MARGDTGLVLAPTRPKLGVCWIWGSPFVWTKSVESMLSLHRPSGYEVQFFRGKGWGPAKRHLDACEQAVAWGADYLLILGADQVYEPDLLQRLLKRVEEGCEVISAAVPTRGYLGRWDMKPFQPMAWRLKPGHHPGFSDDAVEIVKAEDGDLQRIDFIGSGVLMFHRDHLLSLKQPWFFETIDHETQIRTASMDTKFVYRLGAEAYAQVWCDFSIKVQHLSDLPIDETFQDRFLDYAERGIGPSDICNHPTLTLEQGAA